MNIKEETVDKITRLQPKVENMVWSVGEQLKDIARASEHDAS